MTKYEEIQNSIIDKIERGLYKADDKIPSESELIKEWGVSRITVTKALTELMLCGYIYRVQGKGSFVCPLGSHIAKPKTEQKVKMPERMVKKIGVILPGLSATHAGKLHKGITDVFTFPKYFVDTVVCKSKDAEDYALNQFFENGYSGVILYPVDFELYSDIILKMKLSNYPLVLADRSFPGIGCVSVTGDNAKGCELAISHLHALNHKNIAFLSISDYREQVSNARYEAYSMSMNKRGLETNEFHSLAKNENRKQEFIRQIKDKKITAVFACNVSALKQLCDICDIEGISIPDDLSVVNFDNPNTENITSGNIFTHINQKSYEMGKTCANLLTDIIENNASPESRIIQPELVINKSTKKIP